MSKRQQVLQQAATWFVEMQSEYALAERQQAFEQWLSQNPAHKRAYEEVENLWGNLDTLKTQRLAGLETNRSAQARRWRNGKTVLGLLLLGSMLTVIWQDYNAPSTSYATAIGERETIQLADGSQLQLNTATQVSVRFSWWRREITLRHGEALFSVAHQAWPPFTVRTDNLEITDIGTVFNVRLANTGTDISVLEGEVLLNASQTRLSETLSAGYSRKLGPDGRWQKTEKLNPERAVAWASGQLVFDHTPLADVISELERYHPVHFALADSALAQQTLSGSFDSSDLGPFLQALEKILPIRVTRQQHTVTLHKR